MFERSDGLRSNSGLRSDDALRGAVPVPESGRPSVSERVLGILAAFTPDRKAMTLSEIGRHTGLPVATAHRLVRELTRWGALERDEHGVYRIGLRLWEVASLAPRALGLRESAMPFLEDLYEATHQNVQLAVLDGLDVVYVEKISGRSAVNVLTRVGGRFTAPATGVGLALLAHAGPDLQERAVAGPLRRFTERTITSGEVLRRTLAEVRRTGVAISVGQVELVATSVAAPVRGPDGDVVAALSIVVPSGGCSPQMYVPAVRAAALGVSRALGARPAHTPRWMIDDHFRSAESPQTQGTPAPHRRNRPVRR